MADAKSSKKSTRALRHGEPLPNGEPRRYLTSHGYIKLRWKIGPNSYLDIFEHRLVVGRPPDHMQVHHINGVKSDNRPENLMVVTPRQHGAEHITFDLHAAERDYLAGMSYPQLSEKYNVDSAALMRGLKKHRGMKSRGIGEARRAQVDAALVVDLFRRGWRATWIAEELGCTTAVVRNRLDEAGLGAAGRPGRPFAGDRERAIGASVTRGGGQ